VTIDHNWSYVLSISRSHIGLRALIFLPKPHTLGIWVHTWLVMLSHAVMSVMQVFHPFWCWVCLVSLWECCGLPSVEMWFGRVRIDAVVWATVGIVEIVNTCWCFLCSSASAWNCQCSTSPGVSSRYYIYIFPREEGSLSCLRLTQRVTPMSTTRLYNGYVNWGYQTHTLALQVLWLR
jgi:hypothetical protein